MELLASFLLCLCYLTGLCLWLYKLKHYSKLVPKDVKITLFVMAFVWPLVILIVILDLFLAAR